MKHYLYRHIRLDKYEPFYIGIGSLKRWYTERTKYHRANSNYLRNDFWKRIVAKTEYKVEILLESDDYDFIKNKEIEFIKLYGRRNTNTGTLVNLTDGGDGNIGLIVSELSKQKSRERMILMNKSKKYGKPGNKVIDTITKVIYKNIETARIENNIKYSASYLSMMLNNKRKNITNLILV